MKVWRFSNKYLGRTMNDLGLKEENQSENMLLRVRIVL